MSNLLKVDHSIRYVSERELNTTDYITGAYVETASGDPKFECCCDFELKKNHSEKDQWKVSNGIIGKF